MFQHRSARPRHLPAPLFALAFAAGCESSPPRPLPEHNILVVADETLWTAIEDTVESALRTRPIGLADEVTYRIAQAGPSAISEDDLSRFLGVLIFAAPDAPITSTVANAQPLAAPGVLHRTGVWNPDQNVTLVTLTSAGDTDGAVAHLDSVAQLIDQDYREWTRRRMYSSGVNEQIEAAMAAEGIVLRLPSAYQTAAATDSAHLFVTRGNDQARLTRSLLVAWRPLDAAPPSPESVLDWRQSAAERFYEDGQQTQREPVSVTQVRTPAGSALEVRGVWHATIEAFLNAGPFITRIVDCPEQHRRYMLDAWVFAPSRGKHRYLVQMEAILDGFSCEGAPAET